MIKIHIVSWCIMADHNVSIIAPDLKGEVREELERGFK
jgi:hypothetical protein